MRNAIAFNTPFSGFCGTTFISCFTSSFVHLENIYVSGADLEKYYCLFDTMCGRSSLRSRFDGKPTKAEKMICETDFLDGGTKNNTDFLFGFTGYTYRKLTNIPDFRESIRKSIDEKKPVIAKVKSGDNRFRVISGYDDDDLICPDFINALRKPDRAPSYDEIDLVYIFGDRGSAPRFTFTDALNRIRRIMEYNVKLDFWGSYKEKMGISGADGLGSVSIDEKRARMKRVSETMLLTYGSRNFAEAFRNLAFEKDSRMYERFREAKIMKDVEFTRIIDNVCKNFCDYSHDLAWALINLEQCADWSKHTSMYYGGMIDLSISQIAKNDAEVLAAVTEIIYKLDELDKNSKK